MFSWVDMSRYSLKISLEQQKHRKKIKKSVEYHDKYFTIFFKRTLVCDEQLQPIAT